MANRNVRPRLLRDLMTRTVDDPGRQTGEQMIVPQSSGHEVELHVPEGNEAYELLGSLLPTLIETDDIPQRSALYCSIFLCYFPGIRDVIVDVFAEIGISVRLVLTRLERRSMGLELREPITGQESYVFFGQAVFILFKQINPASYGSFMRSRTTALRAIVGIMSREEMYIFATQEVAESLKSILGSSTIFKTALVEKMLASRSGRGRTAAVCNYICNILSWNEMSSIVFMYDALLLTRSPVLRRLEVRREVKNLEAAMTAIASFANPPFFKILSTPSAASVMERSKFPILIEVARKIVSQTSETVTQFATTRRQTSTSNAQEDIVEILLDLHNRYMNGRTLASDQPLEVLYGAGDPTEAEGNTDADASAAPRGGDNAEA